jgi:hypothetical protein
VFKKDETKQAAALEKQAAKQAAAEQKRAAEAEAAFRATPRGRARAAREAGDGFFEYSGSLAETKRTAMAIMGGDSTASGQKRRETSHTDVLSQIEAEGWKLDHVGYLFEPTGTVSRDKMFSSGQTATTTGKIVGVYLFRADPGWTAQPEARFDTKTGQPLAADQQ